MTIRSFGAALLLPSLLLASTREPLWQSSMPGAIPAVKPGADPEGRAIDTILTTDVARPTLTWFIPADADGRALIVCPGGGYALLAAGMEGDAVGARFARNGLSVAVLRYRVPAGNSDAVDAAPRFDLAESIRMAREKMVAKGLPRRPVGVLGFSAGGHLALVSGYGPMPKNSLRPDFIVAVYPAYLLEKNGELRSTFVPDKSSPPACFIHAADDLYSADGSVRLWQKLRSVGVVSELHVFSSGGHGFGLSESGRTGAVAHWSDLVEAWIRRTTH